VRGDQLALEEAQAPVQERALPAELPRLRWERERCGALRAGQMPLEAPIGDLRPLLARERQQRSDGVGAQHVVVIEVHQPVPARKTSCLIAGHGATHQLVSRRVAVRGDPLAQIGVAHARIREPRYRRGGLRPSGIAHDQHLEMGVGLGEQRRK